MKNKLRLSKQSTTAISNFLTECTVPEGGNIHQSQFYKAEEL